MAPARERRSRLEANVELARPRRALGAARRARRARYCYLFEGIADAVLAVDSRGRFLAANPAACRLLGAAEADLVGAPVASVLPDAKSGWFRPGTSRDGALGGELEARRKDGSFVPVEVHVTFAVLPEGKVSIVVLRDVSARPAEEQQRHEMMAMVSHELRNAVTSVRGYAQLVRSRRSSSAQALDVILAQCARLDRLIAELLEWSQARAPGLHLRRARVDLVTIARSVVEQMQALAEHHVLRLDAPTQPVLGWWDGDRLAQVLENLLANAVKYGPEGGEVVVRVEDLGHEARLSVADQGVGIPTEALPKLFTSFFRDATTAERVPGVGLGLAVAHALVAAHGGTIAATSEGPGRGSTFTVTLPYGQEGVPQPDVLPPG